VTAEDTAKLQQSLSLTTARELAVRYNPEFVVTVKKLATAESIAEHAGLWQDPSIGADAGKVLIKDPARDWTSGVTVGLSLPINGALSVEKELAKKQKFAEAANLKQQRISLIESLNATWYDWSSVSEKIDLYQNYTQTLSEMVDRSKKLAEAGELESTDVRQLSIGFAEAKNELSAMKVRQKQLHLQLMQLIGASPNAELKFKPELLCCSVDTNSIRLQLVTDNPQLQLQKAMVEAADSAYKLEIRRQYPDLEISTGYVQDLEERSIPIGISLTLPIWNRNKLGVAKSEKERDAAVAELRATLAVVSSQIRQLELQFNLADSYAQTLESEVIPLINKQMEEVIKRLKVGEVETLLITDVMERSLELKSKLIDAKLEVAKTHNSTHALIGYVAIEKEN
jgi:outer membrane protein TolC